MKCLPGGSTTGGVFAIQKRRAEILNPRTATLTANSLERGPAHTRRRHQVLAPTPGLPNRRGLHRGRNHQRRRTNLVGQPDELVINAYHRLWHIEKAFRMSKHDLQARPAYHHACELIEGHSTSGSSAWPISHWIEHHTGWSIKTFVRGAPLPRTVKIKSGRQTVTGAHPLPDDLRDALAKMPYLQLSAPQRKCTVIEFGRLPASI